MECASKDGLEFGSRVANKRCAYFGRVFGSNHGGSIIAERMVRNLVDEGWTIILVAESFGERAENLRHPRVLRRNVTYWFRSGVAAAIARIREFGAIVRMLRRESIGLVVVQGDLPRLSYLILQFMVPLIFMRQDAILTCPANNRFLPASRRVCSKPASASCLKVHQSERCFGNMGLVQRVGRVVYRVRDAFLLRFFKNFAVLSHYLVRIHRRQGVVLYPPCVSSSGPTGATEDRDLKRVVFCGRLEAVKGAEDAISLVAMLPPEFTLDVIGDGPLRETLEQAAKESDLVDRVRFHGWLATEERDRLMAASGVMFMPSLWDEAFGMVGPEAFAQGTPVVAYDVGGISEWCRRPAGILVPCGEVTQAAAEIRALTCDPRSWRVASDVARQVAAEFSGEAFRTSTLELVHRVCRAGGNRDA